VYIKGEKTLYLLFSLHIHISMMMTFSVLIYVREIVEYASNEKKIKGEKNERKRKLIMAAKVGGSVLVSFGNIKII
jgi:hypothetical protein